jgi:hypothetical protein
MSRNGAWNSSNKGAAVTLSNRDHTAAWAGTAAAVGGTDTKAQGSGKFYFEVAMGTVPGFNVRVGVIQLASGLVSNAWASGALGLLISQAGDSYGSDGVLGSATPFGDGDTVCFAVDLTANKFWTCINGSGFWNTNGAADPATGVGGYQHGASTGAPFVLYGSADGTGAASIVTGSFKYTPPSGFSAWYDPTVYWNVADHDLNLTTFAFDQLINPTTGGWYMGRANLSRNDHRYFELKYNDPTGSTNIIAGVSNGAEPTSDFVGEDTNGVGLWRNGPNVFYGSSGESPLSGSAIGSFNEGDIIGFDVDSVNQQMRFNINGGTFSGWYSIPFVGPYFPAASFSNHGDVLASWYTGDITYTPPTGATPWGDTTTATNRTLAADAGSYILTGTAVTLRATRKIAAGVSIYGYTGSSAVLRIGRTLIMGASSYAVTGQPVLFHTNRRVIASPAAYAVTGQTVGFLRGRRAIAGSAAYVLTGTDANLTKVTSKILALGAGVYNVGGQPVGFVVTRRLQADGNVTYGVVGTDAGLSYRNSRHVGNRKVKSVRVSKHRRRRASSKIV